MKLVSKAFWCLHKDLSSASLSRFSFRTFSSLYHSERNKYSIVSVINNSSSFVNNCNVTKCSFIASHDRYIHGCRRAGPASLKFFKQSLCDRYAAEICAQNMMVPLLIRNSAYSTLETNARVTDFSKSHSALQVKRPARKKLAAASDDGQAEEVGHVVAYAVAEDIDLPSLEKHLVKQGLYNIGKLPQDVTSVLHVRGKYSVEQRAKEIFVFEDGSVIFWGVPEIERSSFLKMLGKFSEGPYSSSLVLYEKEEMDFTLSGGNSCLTSGVIQLNGDDRDSVPKVLEMYAFSNALAQSVKLAMWEASFNKFVASIENVTEDLRQGRKISMSRKQVLMKTGELFSLRHAINLSSGLLDTPDFYWDREALEPLYVSLCNYLNISRRTKIMNQKLNHCSELTELLTSQLNDDHHTRLEVMIIILILVEVVFEIFHTAEKYWNKASVEQPTEESVSTEPGVILTEGSVSTEPGIILTH